MTHMIRRLLSVLPSRLEQDERGAVLAFVALVIVVLIGFSALAIDVGRLYVIRAELQAAADAAALAAVLELPDQEAARTAALDLVGRNLGAGADAGQGLGGAVSFGRWEDGSFIAGAGSPDVVRLLLARTQAAGNPVPTFLAGVLGWRQVEVRVASAARAARPPICLLALDPSASDAFDVGNGKVIADGCSLQVNSDATRPLTGSPGGELRATSICIAGATYGDKPLYEPTPETGCPQLSDPLAELAEPAVGACDHNNYSRQTGTHTLQPGVYCGGMVLNGNLTATLAPGLYVIKDGPFQVNGGARVAGTGVTLYLTGSATLDTSGAGHVSLAAPTSGAFAGILVFGSRSQAASLEHSLKGDGEVYYEGTLYVPTARVRFVGNGAAETPAPFSFFVARTFSFNGNGELRIGSDYGGSGVPVPSGLGPRRPQLMM